MIKVYAYKDRLHPTPKTECSWIACRRYPEWSFLNSENTRTNRAYCTPHALEAAKSNDIPLKDIPMALAEHMNDAPHLPRRAYTAPRRSFQLESWLSEGRNGMAALEQEIADTQAQLEALEARKAVLSSILGAIPEELRRQLDEAMAAAVEERLVTE